VDITTLTVSHGNCGDAASIGEEAAATAAAGQTMNVRVVLSSQYGPANLFRLNQNRERRGPRPRGEECAGTLLRRHFIQRGELRRRAAPRARPSAPSISPH